MSENTWAQNFILQPPVKPARLLHLLLGSHVFLLRRDPLDVLFEFRDRVQRHLDGGFLLAHLVLQVVPGCFHLREQLFLGEQLLASLFQSAGKVPQHLAQFEELGIKLCRFGKCFRSLVHYVLSNQADWTKSGVTAETKKRVHLLRCTLAYTPLVSAAPKSLDCACLGGSGSQLPGRVVVEIFCFFVCRRFVNHIQ